MCHAYRGLFHIGVGDWWRQSLFCIHSRCQSTESRRNICRQYRPGHGSAAPHYFQQGKRDISKHRDVGIRLPGGRRGDDERLFGPG